MRVRKMNQVDVKLHDLTKVKLKTVGNTSVVQFTAGNNKTCTVRNLSKDTYNKYKKKGLIIYCVSKSEKIVDPTVTIYDWQDIEKQINKSQNTKKWLSQTLDWVYIKEK